MPPPLPPFHPRGARHLAGGTAPGRDDVGPPPSRLPSRLLPSTESRASEANRSHNSRKCSRRAGGDGTGPPLGRTPPGRRRTGANILYKMGAPPRSQTKLVYRFHLACRRRRPLLTLTSAALCLVKVVSRTRFVGPSMNFFTPEPVVVGWYGVAADCIRDFVLYTVPRAAIGNVSGVTEFSLRLACDNKASQRRLITYMSIRTGIKCYFWTAFILASFVTPSLARQRCRRSRYKP